MAYTLSLNSYIHDLKRIAKRCPFSIPLYKITIEKPWMNRPRTQYEYTLAFLSCLSGLRRTCFDFDVCCVCRVRQGSGVLLLLCSLSCCTVQPEVPIPERCDVIGSTCACAPVPVAYIDAGARSHWTCSIAFNGSV